MTSVRNNDGITYIALRGDDYEVDFRHKIGFVVLALVLILLSGVTLVAHFKLSKLSYVKWK